MKFHKIIKGICILLTIFLVGCGESEGDINAKIYSHNVDKETVDKEIEDIKKQLQARYEAYILESEENSGTLKYEAFESLKSYIYLLSESAQVEDDSLMNDIEYVDMKINSLINIIDSKTIEEKQEFLNQLKSAEVVYQALLARIFNTMVNSITGNGNGLTIQGFMSVNKIKTSKNEILESARVYIDHFEGFNRSLESALNKLEESKGAFTKVQLDLINDFSDLLVLANNNNIEIIKNITGESKEDQNKLLDEFKNYYKQVKEMNDIITAEFNVD